MRMLLVLQCHIYVVAYCESPSDDPVRVVSTRVVLYYAAVA